MMALSPLLPGPSVDSQGAGECPQAPLGLCPQAALHFCHGGLHERSPLYSLSTHGGGTPVLSPAPALAALSSAQLAHTAAPSTTTTDVLGCVNQRCACALGWLLSHHQKAGIQCQDCGQSPTSFFHVSRTHSTLSSRMHKPCLCPRDPAATGPTSGVFTSPQISLSQMIDRKGPLPSREVPPFLPGVPLTP